MTSQGQHIVASRATVDSSDANYHGVAWIQPSPIGSDISPDADGVYPSPPVILCDLSHMLSRSLGKQMSMTSTYRVTGIKIGVKNVDDIDDNDRGIALAGYIYYHTPTKHKVDAIQASRKIEKASEEDQIDGDSLYINQYDRYSGFRFNWNEDDQVKYPTNAGDVDGWNVLTATEEWNLDDMLILYDNTIAPEQAPVRALWIRKTGGPSLMRWGLSWNNAMNEAGGTLIENPGVDDFEYVAEAGRHIDVMGGLLAVEVQVSNSLPTTELSPDHYDIQVEMTVEGWTSW